MPKVFTSSLRNSPALREVGFLLLGVALLLAEPRSHLLQKARFQLEPLVLPIVKMADLPQRWGKQFALWFTSQRTWQREALLWSWQRSHLQYQQLQLTALEAENAQLRRLLQASARHHLSPVTGYIVQAVPSEHRLRIDVGQAQGIHEGDAVLGLSGAIGIIESTSENYASVILATSPRHALPVVDLRSGVKVNAIGGKDSHVLMIPHVPETTDIRAGDLLATSGLAERFPPGYPVAIVTEVLREPAKPFSTIKAILKQPLNQLDFVMVIPREHSNESS